METWPRQTDAQWLEDTRKRMDIQEQHRNMLMGGPAIDENGLRLLDSTLKKTTAFMKKLKSLNGQTVPALIVDLKKLNLSKFVEEMANGIAEIKLKVSEVPPVIDLCVEITARYVRFSDLLLMEIKKGLPLKKSDKITNPAKLRIDIRFLSELILSGVVGKEGMQTLGATLSYLCLTDKVEHINVGLLCSLCRPVGWQLAGIIPSAESDVAVSVEKDSLKMSSAISPEHRKIIGELLINYYSGLVQHAENACMEMNIVQKKVKRQERTRGDAASEEKAKLETCRAEFEKLKLQMIEMSNSLGIPVKIMNEEPSDDEEDEVAAMEMDKALAEGQVSLWPDEETRVFYENILDIRSIVPKNLYKESEEQTVEAPGMKISIEEIDLEGLDGENALESCNLVSRPRSVSPPLQHEMTSEPIIVQGSEEVKQHMQKFLVNLDHLVNRDFTDETALDFVSNLNTKGNRKRLVKVLFASPCARLDLLPFYARLVASLSPVMPDVSAELTNLLIKQFKDYVQRSSAEKERVEEKIKCVLFISELVKFGVIPRAEGLSCLRQLVYDFRGHSIDMASAMIETMGFFLYRSSDSHAKMKIILDVVQKKKERVKDVRQVMLIDNAFFACVPPEDGRSARRASVDPPVKVFIRHLVLDVNEKNIDLHLRCLRRLDWTNETIADWCLRYLASPWLISYSNLRNLASAVAGLQALSYHDWTAIWVVDSVLEMIRLSLEVPGVFNQWAMACITYIGELYNYSVCDSSVIFKTLYQLVSFPELDEDSWQDFYRIRMICEMLTTVGEFFQTGAAKRKMDYFLTYFHRFYWFKKEQWMTNMMNANTNTESNETPRFPVDVEADYLECTRNIRKGISLPKDLSEAERAVEVIEQQLKDKVDFPAEDEGELDDEDSRAPPIRSLHQIAEEDEEISGSDLDGCDAGICGGDAEDYDRIHVHVEKQSIQPEDEEFQRELDRMLIESFRNSSAQSIIPGVHMTVPTAARHRFQRQICFEDSPSPQKTSDNSASQMKVSLMARGKGNKAILKTVAIEEERLHMSWKKEREREERERADIKRVTLGHTARILAEEEQEQRQTNFLRFK